MNMKTVALVICSSMLMAGCAQETTVQKERYTSPQISVESQKINLEEVEKAFWDSKGTDFPSWMSNFERRVNEVYEGGDVVSIDATREKGHLAVTGYIEDKKQEGFQPGEEKLFAIEQTGEAVNNTVPYKVVGSNNQVYNQGHHSILDNPIVQMMMIGSMMNMWGGRYYTPYSQMTVLRDHRNNFRTTPNFRQQQASNRSFQTRFNRNAGGSLASRNRFGTGVTRDTAPRRTWGAPSTRPGFSPWGGMRRQTGGFPSRGWGGRRR